MTHQDRRPNFLLCFPDQHRPDWLSCNPALPLRTPVLDRLIADGVRFTNAFTPAPECAPARACLATGRDYRRCGVRANGNNTPLTLPTYYAHLRAAGYEVAGVGKFDLHKADRDWGLDGSNLLHEYGFTRGIDSEGKVDAILAYRHNGNQPKGPYMQFLKERGLVATHLAKFDSGQTLTHWLNFTAVTELPDDAYCDNWIAENGLRLLREFAPDKPWHLVFNFAGPHGPFDVTAAMRARWDRVEFPPPFRNADPDQEDVRQRRQNYAAMIENIDMHLGRIVEAIKERGEWERTVVVFASDHGEMLGDHGRWGKSVWYTPAVGIPLIITGPGIQRGVVSDALVSLHDLAATFLDFAGAPALPDSDARSLRPLAAGHCHDHRDVIRSGLMEWDMVFDGRYKLVSGVKPKSALHDFFRRLVTGDRSGLLLYDLLHDPHEAENIAARHPERVQSLLARLEARG